MDKFAAAIQRREVLEIDYAPGRRLIEPHAYGRSAAGDVLLRAFQVEGVSASGEPTDWKLFRLDRMGHAQPTGEHFLASRPGYRRNDKAMKGGIIAQL